MKKAYLIKTGKAVKVVSKKGSWLTLEDGKKVRASAVEYRDKSNGKNGDDTLSNFDLSKYQKSEKLTASGRHILDVNDAVAIKLRGKDLADIYACAAPLVNMSIKDLKSKYAHLNNGMQRMNLGNILRKAARNGESIKL